LKTAILILLIAGGVPQFLWALEANDTSVETNQDFFRCEIYIGAYIRYANDSKPFDQLIGGKVPEVPKYKLVYPSKNWKDCFNKAITEVKKLPPTMKFSVTSYGCGRGGICYAINGPGIYSGLIYADWYFDDRTLLKWSFTSGSVSSYTDQYLIEPGQSDQRFESDGSYFR
jgi:hypothetical protein